MEEVEEGWSWWSILKRVVTKSDPELTVLNQKISRVKFKEDIIITCKFMNRE
jgi:hypothetical protein